jgi:hypothetical protein
MKKSTKNLQKDLAQIGEQTTLFSQEAFHASHTAQQEKDLGKMTSDISGRRCLELYKRLPQRTLWERMFVESVIGTGEWSSTKCKLTWKMQGTKSSRLLFQLAPSTLPIEGIGFGLLPTPKAVEIEENYEEWRERMVKSGNPKNIGKKTTNLGTMARSGMLLKTPSAADAYSEKLNKKEQKFGNSGTLAQEIQTGFVENRWPGLLPTPTQKNVTGGAVQVNANGKRQNSGGTEFSAQLHDLAKSGLLPTPRANKVNGCNLNSESLANRNKGNLEEAVSEWVVANQEQTGKTSQLNPQFVLEMMGFQPSWTELPFLSGETNPSKPQETQ